MIPAKRYTSGRLAVANLSASISALELCRVERPSFESLLALSDLLFVRGDLLGRTNDQDRAESVAHEAIAMAPDTGRALYTHARLAERSHRFDEANALLGRALAVGYPPQQIDVIRASVLQATHHYSEALALRERLAKADPGIHTLGALASLLAEMNDWVAAESCYAAALAADTGVSPFPCGQLLFEWGVSAMRHGDLDRAEEVFVQLNAILPQDVRARAMYAQVLAARGAAA